MKRLYAPLFRFGQILAVSVTIGGRERNLVLDTGSAHIWLKDSGLVTDESVTITVQFASGMASGNPSKEPLELQIGDVKGLVTPLVLRDSFAPLDEGIDGILGLGGKGLLFDDKIDTVPEALLGGENGYIMISGSSNCHKDELSTCDNSPFLEGVKIDKNPMNTLKTRHRGEWHCWKRSRCSVKDDYWLVDTGNTIILFDSGTTTTSVLLSGKSCDSVPLDFQQYPKIITRAEVPDLCRIDDNFIIGGIDILQRNNKIALVWETEADQSICYLYTYTRRKYSNFFTNCSSQTPP